MLIKIITALENNFVSRTTNKLITAGENIIEITD